MFAKCEDYVVDSVEASLDSIALHPVFVSGQVSCELFWHPNLHGFCTETARWYAALVTMSFSFVIFKLIYYSCY